jgi:hypothetical protein
LDGIDDRKSISFASSFGTVSMNSIGLPFCDRTVAMKSVTVPLDLTVDRTNSISPGSDSVERAKTSISPGRNSVSVDRFSGSEGFLLGADWLKNGRPRAALGQIQSSLPKLRSRLTDFQGTPIDFSGKAVELVCARGALPGQILAHARQAVDRTQPIWFRSGPDSSGHPRISLRARSFYLTWHRGC